MTQFKRTKVNENGSAEFRQDGSTISIRTVAGLFVDDKIPEALSVEIPDGFAFAPPNSAKLEAQRKKEEREKEKADKKAAAEKAKADKKAAKDKEKADKAAAKQKAKDDAAAAAKAAETPAPPAN